MYKHGHVLATESSKVYCHLHLSNLLAVNTKEQTWTCAYNIFLAWCVADTPEDTDVSAEEALLSFVEGIGDADDDWRPEWVPETRVDNAIEQSSMGRTNAYTVLAGDASGFQSMADWRAAIDKGDVTADNMWVVLEDTQKVTIADPMELEDFPFDKQDVDLTVYLGDEASRTELLPLSQLPSEDVLEEIGIYRDLEGAEPVTADLPDMDTAGFIYSRKMPYKYKLDNSFFEPSDRRVHGAVRSAVFLNRQIEYYLYNMLLMVFSITMVGGFVWATKPADLCCRLQLDFVVLLVSQAFKLVISDHLPHLTYLTKLDVYILGSFVFSIAAIGLHSWMGVVMEHVSDARPFPPQPPTADPRPSHSGCARDGLGCRRGPQRGVPRAGLVDDDELGRYLHRLQPGLHGLGARLLRAPHRRAQARRGRSRLHDAPDRKGQRGGPDPVADAKAGARAAREAAQRGERFREREEAGGILMYM